MENNVHILVVEDSPTQAVEIQYLLEKNHFQVTIANDGKQALEMLQQITPTIIISDIVMPKMNGYELCNAIKENVKLKDIPVILLTSLSDPEDVINGLVSGANNFIVKPYDENFLISRIKYILANMEIRKTFSSQMGIEIIFRDKKYFLTSERVQMIDLLLSTYEAAIQRNLDFQIANEKLQQARDELESCVQERTYELGERVKEIKCLYAVSDLVAQPRKTIDESLKVAVDLIPPGLQYPEITRARIVFEGREFATEGFSETPWKLSADIVISGETVGTVDVCYLEERPALDEGPFFKEERDLVNDIARQLGVMIQRESAHAQIEHINSVLRSIRDVNQLIIRDKQRGPLIEGACRSLVRTRGFRGAWIVLTDRLPGDFQSAHSGFPDDAFREFTRRVGKGSPPTCCQRAISEGGVVAIANPVRECGDCPLVRGYNGGAGLGVALVHGERQFGCMGVSVPAQYANDEQEKSLLAEIAGDLAFALYGMDVEAERKRSEQTLEAIFQSASDGILLADAESETFVKANDAICRMLGCSAEEIKRLSVADIHPIESVDSVRSLFERQARGEVTLAPDILMKRIDGSVFFADVSSAPINLEGRPHLLGIFRDITPRKQAEAALQESEERFRTLFEYAPDAYYLNDFEGRFIDGNRAMEEMTGHRKEELLGRSFLDLGLLSPDDLRKAAELLQKSAQGLSTGPDELILHRRDGKQISIEIHTLPLKIEDRDMVLGIARDITERKNLEQQLIQSQKLEAVGSLAAGIAHDFNNLLTTIIGNAELALGDTGKDDPRREMIEEIKGAGERAAGLTRQLLAFSRKQILQPEVIHLNEIVKDMEKMLLRIIGEDIELRTDLAGDLGQVEVDVGQMEQVIMNLCVNARDAMAKGGKLTIETRNTELDEAYANGHIAVIPGPYVMLAVSDTGIGMTKEVQSQLFEPFFTTKEKGKGTGLGLSTVYGIVKQSNGNIWVYSEPGKGTTFKIYFPRCEEIPMTREKAEREEEMLQGTETVLVVEDDEMVRNMAVKSLKRYGYHVLWAPDGREALHILQEQGGMIHLMLTDVVMPGMSGRNLGDLAREMRGELKVLYMSGYTDNAIVHHGVLDKGIPFLQKPFTPDRLAKKVREVLNG